MDGDCVKPVLSGIVLLVVFNDPWYVSRYTGAGAGGAAVWRVLLDGLALGEVNFGSMYCANTGVPRGSEYVRCECIGWGVWIICRSLDIL
jgi:hypothetical protein